MEIAVGKKVWLFMVISTIAFAENETQQNVDYEGEE